MKNSEFSLHLKTLLSIAVLGIFVSGCSQQPKHEIQKPKTEIVNDNQGMAEISQQMEAVRQAESPVKEQILLQISHTFLKHREHIQAENILQIIDHKKLDENRLDLYHLHHAAVFIAKQKAPEAIEWLDTHINPSRLILENQIRYSKLKSNAFAHNGQYLASAKELILIGPSLKFDEKKINNETIWLTLSQLETRQLETFLKQEKDPNLIAWIELAFINKAFQNDIELQAKKFNEWMRNWKQHDAADALPETIYQIQKALLNRPKKIAFLLPESGPLANSSNAIKQGFMLAYYDALERNTFTPALRFYDSSKNGLRKFALDSSANLDNAFLSLYQQAINDGANLIIGPIQREHIALLQNQKRISTPTIALNYNREEQHSHPQLIQFGLAPEDELLFIAEQAFLRDFKNAAVLYPNTSWGERLASTFTTQWEHFGGKIVNATSYSDERSISPSIKSMLNIDKSEQRHRRLYRYSDNKALFFARPRQDIDFIFLVASPEMGRQIMPTFSFHHASDIPVLSNSSIYEGKHHTANRDLHRLIFTDIPWMLEQQTQQRLEKTWDNFDHRYSRLMAMGNDVYQLSFQIDVLRVSERNKLYGTTGILTLGNDYRIKRQPGLARFQHSNPRTYPVLINPGITNQHQFF